MSDNETYYYVRSTKFCLFYMYVYLFYTFIRLMLLRLCSQHYFILMMNPVTFYNNDNKYVLKTYLEKRPQMVPEA